MRDERLLKNAIESSRDDAKTQINSMRDFSLIGFDSEIEGNQLKSTHIANLQAACHLISVLPKLYPYTLS